MSFPELKRTDYFATLPDVLDVQVSDIVQEEGDGRLYVKTVIKHTNPTADLGWSNFQFVLPLEGYQQLREALAISPRSA